MVTPAVRDLSGGAGWPGATGQSEFAKIIVVRMFSLRDDYARMAEIRQRIVTLTRTVTLRLRP